MEFLEIQNAWLNFYLLVKWVKFFINEFQFFGVCHFGWLLGFLRRLDTVGLILIGHLTFHLITQRLPFKFNEIHTRSQWTDQASMLLLAAISSKFHSACEYASPLKTTVLILRIRSHAPVHLICIYFVFHWHFRFFFIIESIIKQILWNKF